MVIVCHSRHRETPHRKADSVPEHSAPKAGLVHCVTRKRGKVNSLPALVRSLVPSDRSALESRRRLRRSENDFRVERPVLSPKGRPNGRVSGAHSGADHPLGFVVWTMLVVLLGIGLPRAAAVLERRAAPNSFVANIPHGTERYQRTLRAHANCVENLPLFASLVLLGRVVSLESWPFEAFAIAVLPARIAQTTAHIASGSNRAVLVRFSFFTIQLGCFAGMAALLALRFRG